jgi:hypothetical protein
LRTYVPLKGLNAPIFQVWRTKVPLLAKFIGKITSFWVNNGIDVRNYLKNRPKKQNNGTHVRSRVPLNDIQLDITFNIQLDLY